MNSFKIRKQIAEKRAALSKILNACEVNGVTRDMTPEEKGQFDALMVEVDGLKAQLDRAEKIEALVIEPGTDPEPAPAPQQGRSSDPNQFRDGQSPAVHTAKRSYSLLRALSLAAEGSRPDGLEGEVSTEVRKIGAAMGKRYRGQFTMPIDPEPGLRSLMYPRYQQRADLTTSTGAGGIFTVPEMPMIDLLRARMVLTKLGCTFLTGMQGLFAIPRQNGKSTVNWIAEGSGATNSSPTLDQVPFSPKLAVDIINVSRQFINQTSVSAESFAMNDLARTMAVELDRVGINGGATNEPVGVLQNSSVVSGSSGLALGANGGAVAWANVIDMETQVANANADQGPLKYLTSPALRGTLKNTPKVAESTFPIFVWENDRDGVGEVNGYPAFTTSNVPSNLTKGSGSNLTALVLGYWEDLVVASWGDGIDFLVNPYTNQSSAAVLISMEMSVDTEVRHPQSFAVISDATFAAF